MTIKRYTAEEKIEGHRLLTFGTNADEVKPATAGSTVIGVTNFVGARIGKSVDVDFARYTELTLDGTVARGDKLTAAADGKAVKATSSDEVCAVALAAGVAGDIIPAIMK